MHVRWIWAMALFTGLVESQVPPNLSCYSPRPFNPSFTDKYAALPGHLNCKSGPFLGKPIPTNITEQTQIADLHNKIRARVTPPAADMTQMNENSGIGSTAERFARRCSAESTWYQRATPGGYLIGQNHLYSNTLLTWTDVIRIWEAENTSFVYGSTGNNPSLVGNYTQMVSSETSSVGCGAAQCSGFYLYICLYAPMLDPVRINKPYKESNTSCDDCPGKCNGTLCDYGGLICLSGSKLNMSTYTCGCVSTVRPGTYSDSVCFLNCIGTTDSDPECSRSLLGTCGTKIDTMFRCPWMCNVCPYSDRSWNATLISKMPWELGLPDCTTTPLPTTSHSTNAYAQQQNDGSMVSFDSVLYIGCTTIVMLKQLTIC